MPECGRTSAKVVGEEQMSGAQIERNKVASRVAVVAVVEYNAVGAGGFQRN